MQRCSSIRTGSFPPTRRPAASPAGSTPRCATCRSSPRTGTCRPTWIAEDVPFGDPTSPADLPRPLRHPAAARRTASRWRPSAPAARPLTPDGPRAAWRALCTHWDAFRGTPEPVLAGERARRHLRGDRAAVRRHRRRDLRPGRRRRCAGPTSGRGRCCERFGIEVLATTDDPCDDLAHHAAIRDDAAVVDPRAADLPARPLPRAGPRRLAPSWSTRSAPRPTPTPPTTRASSPRWRTGAGTSSRTAPSPPTTATPTSAPPRWTTPRPSGSSRRPGRARRRRTRPRRCAATCCWRWRGCRSTTAW